MDGDFYGGIEVTFTTEDGKKVEVFHTGNFRPSDYLPKVGGRVEGDLAIDEDLVVKKNASIEVNFAVKGATTLTGAMTSNGGATLNGNNTVRNLTVKDSMSVKSTALFEQAVTYNETVRFKKSIIIDGITKFGNGIEITSGVSRFKSKVLISDLAVYKDQSPVITLALGDGDTGFNSQSDGITHYYKNNVELFEMSTVWRSNNFTPNTKFDKTGGTIEGSIVATGTIHANGDITAFSDRRLKTDIKPIGKTEFEKLMEIESYTYTRRGLKEYGVIAQELEEVFPRLVMDGDEDTKTKIRYKRVKYFQMIPLLLNGLRLMYNDIKEIKRQLNQMR